MYGTCILFCFFQHSTGGASELPSQHTDKINIAVVGLRKSGKSSLINAVRDLTSRDPLAARTEIERPTKYTFSETALIWEFPAVAEVTSAYLESVEFGQFDGVIVCCNTVLLAFELSLADVCYERGVPVAVVRTNTMATEPRVNVLRQVIEGQLRRRYHLVPFSVFLIGSGQDDTWDMEQVKGFIKEVRKRDIKAEALAADVEKIEINKPAAEPAEGLAGGASSEPDTPKIVRKAAAELRRKLQDEIENVVMEAASMGNVDMLDEAIFKYQDSFGQADLDMGNTNTNAIRQILHSKCKTKKSTKRKGGYLIAITDVDIQIRREVILEHAYSLLRAAIKKCYDAAARQSSK